MTTVLSPDDPLDAHDSIVAVSAAMQGALTLARRYAQARCSVLVSGATGTGKEVLARYIHGVSGSARPFIDVNCAALPREMLEGLLFGHRRGTFTGAVEHQRGLIEAAHGGTLYLDELCSLPSDCQAKLLRVLESRLVRRLGEEQSRVVDIQLIASVQGEVSELRRSGRLRDDLFYRLAVGRIYLPPLAARREDIVPLARVIASRAGRRLDVEAELLLRAQPWDGNVRELHGVITRALLVTEESVLAREVVMWALTGESSGAPRETGELDTPGARDLLRACLACDWDTREVAKLLGIGRATVYRRLVRYGIRQAPA